MERKFVENLSRFSFDNFNFEPSTGENNNNSSKALLNLNKLNFPKKNYQIYFFMEVCS